MAIVTPVLLYWACVMSDVCQTAQTPCVYLDENVYLMFSMAIWISEWFLLNFFCFLGNEYTLDKMDQVRESQESLAQLHFELDVEESHR
jgi:hypothetical protein